MIDEIETWDWVKTQCKPTENLYKDNSSLKKNPIKAMAEVRLVGGGEGDIIDPIAGLLVSSGKLETAEKELGHLTPKQKEAFSGVKENIDGAIAWALHSKVGKKALNSALVVSMALSSAGCTQVIARPIETFESPTPITQTFTPTPTEMSVGTSTVAPTETQILEPTEIPYPVSVEGFMLETKGFRLSDREEVANIGKSQDMRKLEDMYRAEITRNGEDKGDFLIDVIFWKDGKNHYWEDVIRDSSYHFLGVKITTGADTGKISLGLSRYLADYQPEDDFFDFFPIENPPEYPKASQEIFWDKSGNPIVGIIDSKGYLSAWFNMSKGEQGEWEIESLPAGETEAQDIWQLSPDGHIYYNEKELYDGLFTINKEHPEWVEQYWEDTIRGLWNLNYVSENDAFIGRFPTDDALIDYLKNGGGPVSNLWIPVIYPSAQRLFLRQATMVPASGKIDLSKIAIGIYKPTTEEIYKYNSSYATGTKYISYSGAAGEIMIEEKDIGNSIILKMTHRRDLLVDALRMPFVKLGESGSAKEFYMLSISPDKNVEENLLAATQLLKYWNRQALMKTVDGWAEAYRTYYSPPILNVDTIKPTYQECVDITTIEGSPIAIR